MSLFFVLVMIISSAPIFDQITTTNPWNYDDIDSESNEDIRGTIENLLQYNTTHSTLLFDEEMEVPSTPTTDNP